MLSIEDANAVWLTLKLATVTTLILLLLATPLAWWLAFSRTYFRNIVAACVALPLVLPPTVLGFYLLILFSPQNWLGQFTQSVGLGTFSFSFTGLVIGSILFSLPFAVQPIQNGFEAIGPRPLEVAATLRASATDRFLTVILPLCKPSFMTAAILVFAHTVGEFGVVLMLGGNISGETRVLSIAIYNHVEALEYQAAHFLAAGMVLFSFIVLLVLSFTGKRYRISP